MDFSTFIPVEMISPLLWLGKRHWISFKDIPEQNRMLVKPIECKPDRDEMKKHPILHWAGVEIIQEEASKNGISALWHLTLSKILAEGPKLFKATDEQCEDLEATDVSFPFSDHHQPYQTFILELPPAYSARLAASYKVSKGPTHVFCHKEEQFIVISAFFNSRNVITNLITNRPQYATLEDAICKNRGRQYEPGRGAETGLAGHDLNDFEIAEVVQRLAINFGMYMTLIGVHVAGPLDPLAGSRHEAMARSGNKDRARAGKALMEGEIALLKFDQVVKFHTTEEFPAPRGEPTGEKHRSPKPHRRRGHWRRQPYGVGGAERRWIPIKPVLVRAWAFVGDEKDTQVTYIPKGLK